MRITFYLVTSTILVALGVALSGFDTAAIAGITHELTEIYHLTPITLGITLSIALWEAVAGISPRFIRHVCASKGRVSGVVRIG